MASWGLPLSFSLVLVFSCACDTTLEQPAERHPAPKPGDLVLVVSDASVPDGNDGIDGYPDSDASDLDTRLDLELPDLDSDSDTSIRLDVLDGDSPEDLDDTLVEDLVEDLVDSDTTEADVGEELDTQEPDTEPTDTQEPDTQELDQGPFLPTLPCATTLGMTASVEAVCDPSDPNQATCITFDDDIEQSAGVFQVRDSSMYTGHGTGTSIGHASGIHGLALELDGTAQVDVPWHAGLTLNGPVTVEAWVYVEAYPTIPRAGIVDGAIAGATTFLYQDGRVRCWVNNQTLFSQPIDTNTWVHVVCMSTGSEQRIYIDGTLAESGANTPVVVSQVDDTYEIGANHPNGELFVGRIDTVRIWRTARTEEEICNAASQRPL